PSLSLALQSITPTTLFFFLTIPPPPNSTLFPYTTLFRSRELATLYSAFAAGTQATLPELPIQYVDYAQWQRGWLLGEVLNGQLRDRKSTRLNSSHVEISYAVFCLKKKKNKKILGVTSYMK